MFQLKKEDLFFTLIVQLYSILIATNIVLCPYIKFYTELYL